jgi:type II secretory pathway pseudopilin PulG
MKTLKNQKGTTLVEAVVTFMVVGFMAGGFMSILDLNISETSEGVLSSQLQMQYENVIEQISRDIRSATYVLDQGAGETFANAESYTTSKNNVIHMLMYGINGAVIAGYQIQNNTLLEYDVATTSWVPYKAGNKTVSVTANSAFALAGARKAAQAQIYVTSTYKNAVDSLTENTNYIHCRN